MPRTATPTLVAAIAAFGASFAAGRWWRKHPRRENRSTSMDAVMQLARAAAVGLGGITIAGEAAGASRRRGSRLSARDPAYPVGAVGATAGRAAGGASDGATGRSDGVSSDTAAGARPTGLRAIWALIRNTVSSWSEDYAPSMGAALSYYTLFSLAPLLLLVISLAGLFFGEQAARGEIFAQLQSLVGEEGASAIEDLLASVQSSDKGSTGTAIGLALLAVGATTVFAELQSALDRIWRSPRASKPSGVWGLVRSRLLSFGLVLALGFLLMVSLVASAALAAFARWWSPMFGGWEVVAQVANLLVSLLLLTAIFSLIYKLMPSVDVAWRDVLLGSAVTALLFSIGKLVIGLYIGRSGVASGFGAASSIVVLLVWVYYSAQIFLLGAEFTWVYARRYGSRREFADGSRPPATRKSLAEGSCAQSAGSEARPAAAG